MRPIIMMIQDSAFSFFTTFDLIGVRQIERLLTTVQVYEMRYTQAAESVHDVPGIIFRDGHLVQSHIFRSIKYI